MPEVIDHADQFKGLDDRLIPRPSTRVTASREHVYTHCIWGSRPAANDTCEALIQLLISLCLSSPSYIASHECRRHAAFLHDFSNSKVPDYFGWTRDLIEAKNLPIKYIFKALELWVESFFNPQYSSLFPHFALHTAHLVEKIVSGSHERDDPSLVHWRIEPLIEGLAPRGDFLDRPFKKRFTEHTYCRVLAEVPKGIVLSHYGQELHAGESFVFEVSRCHLSEKFSDGPFVKIEPPTPNPDLQLGELKLKGEIITYFDDDSQREWRWRVDLPASWITHEIREDERGAGQAEAVPVQCW